MTTIDELKEELIQKAIEDAKASLALKIYGSLFLFFILCAVLLSKFNNVFVLAILLIAFTAFFFIPLFLPQIKIPKEKISKEYDKIIADKIKDYPEKCRELAKELWELKRYYNKHYFKNYYNSKLTLEFYENKQNIAIEYDKLKKKYRLLLDLQQAI